MYQQNKQITHLKNNIMDPLLNYPDHIAIFSKMELSINKKELYSLFPNGAISFAVQLSRGKETALNMYNSFKQINSL